MGKGLKNISKILIILLLVGILVCTIYSAVAGFSNNDSDAILDYVNNPLQKKTQLWGDLSDDALGMIKRMTEPDIGYYPSKMKLVDYADVIQ